MKKLFALVLSLLTVFAMAVPVLAAEEASPYSITVNRQSANVSIVGKAFSAYKLFDVKYNEDKTSFYYTVASEFSEFTYGEKSGTDLAAYLSTLSENSDELNAFAETALQYATDNAVAPKGSVIAAAEKGNIIKLAEPGYYLVAGTAAADGNKTVTAACSLTTTKPTAEIEVKADAPKLDKVIVKDGTDKKGASADIGSVVNFKLTSKVPDMTGYSAYKYIVHDTMSSGLTFNKDIVVKIGDKTLAPDTDYTLTVPGAGGETFTVEIKDFIRYTKGDKIVVTYSATVNENALTTDIETNKTTLEYSNNPYDETDTEKTPEDKVYVYDFDIIIDKYVDGDAKAKLAGAQFVLKNADGKYYHYNTETKKVEWVDEYTEEDIRITDENGYAAFIGMKEGTYELIEIAAPNGYNKLDTPVSVVIEAEYSDDGTIIMPECSTTVIKGENNFYMEIGIGNAAGPELPGTGGIGNTIFYAVGGLLMLAAVIAWAVKKKMSAYTV